MQTNRVHTTVIGEMLLHEFSSLCNTCDHFTSCTFPDARKNVQVCELFETESAVNRDASLFVQPGEEINSPEVKGICSNCSMLKTCSLPKNLAGVWHCEEYV